MSPTRDDPEKGPEVVLPPQRDTSEVERPLSVHSSSASEHSVDSDISRGRRKDHVDLEKISSHRDGILPPAIIGGEPSHLKAEHDANEERRKRSRSRRRSQSRGASTVRSRAVTIVPRSKRRGLFGRFTIVPEVSNPYEYKNGTKWGITVTIAMATMAAPLGSSIFYPALPSISNDFGVDDATTNLSVAMYMIAMSIFPLWWSAFSEEFGRRTIYLISFALFVVFSIASALSVNIAMLIVFRIGGGGASASVQAVGAGTIADIWEPYERGTAIGWYYLGPLLGPMIAPIVGGILSEAFGWRSTMWFLAIYGFVVWCLLFFLLPETLARKASLSRTTTSEELSRLSTRESAKLRTTRFAKQVKHFLIDPLKVLLLLRFPAVLCTVLIAAFAFGALFLANISIQQEFSLPPYNYSQIIVGLLYLPPALGYFLASLFGGRWIDKIMAREARKAGRYDEQGKLVYLPEDRMRENMWFAHTLYPLALIMYGWTLYYGLHFMVPSVALFLFGLASMLVFSAGTTMLTEFVKKKSSGGVAVNNFVRNILSTIGVAVGTPWIDAIGCGWVFTITGIFCMVAGSFGIWLLRRNAEKWRKDMDEAMNED